jgi:ABC-type multidrug transport system fused ATPase/permease subunit
VAIARSLLRRPRLLLLDDASSQLDARAEGALRRAVQVAAHHCTVIAVAHLLATVVDADRIVLLDAGRVRTIGTHAELYAGDELYRALASSQVLHGPTLANYGL